MTTDALLIHLIHHRAKIIHRGGGVLAAKGPEGPLPPDLLAAIRTHKRELLRRMAQVERTNPEQAGNLAALIDPDYLAGLRERFEERAAIMELDGGLSREQAEADAHDEIMGEVLGEACGTVSREGVAA